MKDYNYPMLLFKIKANSLTCVQIFDKDVQNRIFALRVIAHKPKEVYAL